MNKKFIQTNIQINFQLESKKLDSKNNYLEFANEFTAETCERKSDVKSKLQLK